MKAKKIEVPVLPGELIYYVSGKFGIVEYKVYSLRIKEKGIFIEVEGDFDQGEEIVFPLEKIGREIFLSKNEAIKFMRKNNGR